MSLHRRTARGRGRRPLACGAGGLLFAFRMGPCGCLSGVTCLSAGKPKLQLHGQSCTRTAACDKPATLVPRGKAHGDRLVGPCDLSDLLSLERKRPLGPLGWCGSTPSGALPPPCWPSAARLLAAPAGTSSQGQPRPSAAAGKAVRTNL